jgi:hypothetical protein
MCIRGWIKSIIFSYKSAVLLVFLVHIFKGFVSKYLVMYIFYVQVVRNSVRF